MKKIRKFFLWYALFTKRLIRRPAYLAVLLLVPLFAAAVAMFSRGDSGVLTTALVMRNPEDPAAQAAVERLTTGDSILRCLVYESEEAARDAVRMGKVDAAWVFGEDFEYDLYQFAKYDSGPAITVIEREENVFLMIAREKLFAAIYPETSYSLFRAYLEKDLRVKGVDRHTLEEYYHSGDIEERVLRFETVEGEEADTEGSYLTAPLRGIMALLLVLCGLASGLYCYREERNGSFVWLSARMRRCVPLLSHVTAILPPAIAALIAMKLAGITVGLGRELLMMLMYIPATALFCELLRCLCPKEEHYGALIPVLTVAMLVLCPVFLDLNLSFVRPVRWLLPPYWVLRAVWDKSQLWMLLLYSAVLLPLTALAAWLRQRRRGL